MTLSFHSTSSGFSSLSMPYLLQQQSLSPSVMINLPFPHGILSVSLYLGSLVKSFLRFLFPTNRKSPVTICWWSLFIKSKPAQLHGKIVCSKRKALTPRLETDLLKLDILDRSTLMSSTALFTKEILQKLVGALLLDFDIVDLNILDSLIYRAKEYHWKYIELLSSSKLSWRRAVYINSASRNL